jgi:hypothetical protein
MNHPRRRCAEASVVKACKERRFPREVDIERDVSEDEAALNGQLLIDEPQLL